MERAVHRVGSMIACHFRRKALLLSVEDFGSLATKLMSDLGDIDIIFFKVAIGENLGVRSAKEKYKEWEKLFCARLLAEIESGNFRPFYDFKDDDARHHIENFLEAFRYSYRSIDYAVGSMHDGTDEVINISLRNEQKLLDRVLNRLGKTYTDINILKSEVRRINGSSLDFTLNVGDVQYQFSQEGVR